MKFFMRHFLSLFEMTFRFHPSAFHDRQLTTTKLSTYNRQIVTKTHISHSKGLLDLCLACFCISDTQLSGIRFNSLLVFRQAYKLHTAFQFLIKTNEITGVFIVWRTWKSKSSSFTVFKYTVLIPHTRGRVVNSY